MIGIGLGIRIGKGGGGASAPDGNPSALIASIVNDERIDLSWTIGSTNHDAHEIFMSIAGGSFVSQGTVSGTTNTKAIIGLTPLGIYEFYVVARKGAIYSDNSNRVEVVLRYANSSLIAGWKMDGTDEFSDSLQEFSATSAAQSAMYYNGFTYIAFGSTNSNIYVTKFNHSTKEWSTPVLAITSAVYSNGHGQPTLCVDSSGYIHVVGGNHGGNMLYSRSHDPETITSWDVMTSPFNGYFPQIISLSNNKLILFYDGNAQTHYYKESSDNGDNWSASTKISDNYGVRNTVKGLGDTIHIVFAGHNGAGTDRYDIFYLYYDGTNFKDIKGVNQTLPVNGLTTDVRIYNSGTLNVPLVHVKADSNNYPYFIFTTGESETDPGEFTYKFMKWSGSSMSSISTLGVTTTRHRNQASNLIIKSATEIETYLVASGNTSILGGNIEKWKSFDSGATWTKMYTVLEGNYLDPIVPTNYTNDLVFWVGEYTGDAVAPTRKGYAWGSNGFVVNTSVLHYAREIKNKSLGILGYGVNRPAVVAGRYGNAYAFSANNNIIIKDALKFSFTDGSNDLPFTISAWIKLTDTSGLQYIVAKLNPMPQYEWRFILYNSVLYFSLYSIDGGTNINNTTPFSTTNTWKFICAVYNGDATKEGADIYIDGSLGTMTRSSSAYAKMSNSSADVIIGADYLGASNLKGSIDEVKIWNKALSVEEQILVMNNDLAW